MSEQNRKLILTIDDDIDFNNVLKVILKKMGFETKTTTRPEEFLKLIKNEVPNLVIIDLNLDVAYGAGFQIIQAIRKIIGFKLPIIVVSKRTDQNDIAKALELGANDFVPKPLDPLILENKIQQLLDTKFYRNPLPLFIISDKDKSCGVDIPMQIHSINEFGVTLKGPYFISKGTPIYLSGPMMADIVGFDEPMLMTANNSWIDETSRNFFSFFEFDFENHNLMGRVRKWLLHSTQHS